MGLGLAFRVGLGQVVSFFGLIQLGICGFRVPPTQDKVGLEAWIARVVAGSPGLRVQLEVPFHGRGRGEWDAVPYLQSLRHKFPKRSKASTFLETYVLPTKGQR